MPLPLVALVASCGGADAFEPTCVPNLSASCQPLYDPPAFQALYDNILHPTCASGSGTCHSADGARAGLVFEERDTAYALLLGTTGGRVRVLPGDPSCSLLMERLESKDARFRMPPGSTPLSAAELCTFVKWIAEGAMP